MLRYGQELRIRYWPPVPHDAHSNTFDTDRQSRSGRSDRFDTPLWSRDSLVLRRSTEHLDGRLPESRSGDGILLAGVADDFATWSLGRGVCQLGRRICHTGSGADGKACGHQGRDLTAGGRCDHDAGFAAAISAKINPAMAKTLLLLRHAKSSWDNPSLDDFDRPLNDRGRKSAKRVGRHIRKQGLTFDIVLCSKSVRTKQTAELAFSEWQPPPEICERDDLYHATPDEIRRIVGQVSEPATSVLVIGHNPGFEELLSQLTGAFEPFPTAALARVELDLDDWSQLRASTQGRLIEMWRPRDQELD